jgi:UDP-3-O-[3-hydroxymyristoyl] glucosamine N-acyltransferase
VALSLAEIVAALGGELHGDPALQIGRLAALDRAGPGDLSFLSNPKYQQQLGGSRAGCVIVGQAMREAAMARGACIVAEDPYLYFARLTRLWKQRHAPTGQAGIHPSAVVDPLAQVHPSASIGPLCVVESGARIGAGTVLKARVHVGEGCLIGERCILHPGVVIGADGFGFAPHQGRWEKIEQLGAVRIGDDVDVGANTCIDRGALEDTVIEDGVKLDNLIQIAHNCRIGKHTAIAACTGIAGSTTIGAHCTIGGAAMIVGHISIADHVFISAGTFVSRSVSQPGHYTGIFPMDDNASWEKNAAALRQLYRLRERVKALEKK